MGKGDGRYRMLVCSYIKRSALDMVAYDVYYIRRCPPSILMIASNEIASASPSHQHIRKEAFRINSTIDVIYTSIGKIYKQDVMMSQGLGIF